MITKTLPSNSIQTGHDGLDFDASNETWIINPGVTVSTETGLGVSSHGFANTTLINDGTVESTVDAPGDDAVYLVGGGNASVVNTTGALIFGAYNGVVLNGDGNNYVYNRGDIIGEASVGLDFGQSTGSIGVFSNNVLLNNYGDIFGGFAGVYLNSNFVGGTINNLHLIQSSAYGVYLNTTAYLTTNVANAAGGVIQGLAAAIYMASGTLHLVNHGRVIGDIVDTTNLHEVIINPGTIHGAIRFGTGNDVFNGTGGTSGAIYAGGGNDRIIGGNGNVKIYVGTGHDLLTAGPGHDQFIFDSAPAGQVERITNFNPSLDKIDLTQGLFPGVGPLGHPLAAADFHIGAHATTASQHIIYNPNNGFLFYDSDGNGPNAQIHFATIGTHVAMTHTDFLVVA